MIDGGYAPKGFTMATALKPGRSLQLLLTFLLGKVALGLAKYAPLERVATIHFASFIRLDALPGSRLSRPYLLFASVFDGAPSEYLVDFGTLVPSEIDRIWSHCVRYPGARAGAPFIHWIGDRQLRNVYFYSGYEGQTVPDVQHAVALRERIARFVELAHGDELVPRLRRFIRDVRDLLG